MIKRTLWLMAPIYLAALLVAANAPRLSEAANQLLASIGAAL